MVSSTTADPITLTIVKLVEITWGTFRVRELEALTTRQFWISNPIQQGLIPIAGRRPLTKNNFYIAVT